MSLPTYAEGLKRLNDARPFDDQAYADVAAHVELHLDRILRDAEIAEACRAYVRAIDAGDGQEMSHAEVEMFDLIAKETP